MKSQALQRALFAVIAVTVGTAISQTKPGDTIVNVPFPFMVANQQMRPGKYIVAELAGDLRMVDDHNHTVLAPVHPVRGQVPEGAGKLVFHRYGDSYFLCEVWSAGNSTGKQLYPSKAEREMARSMAPGQNKPEVAELQTGR